MRHYLNNKQSQQLRTLNINVSNSFLTLAVDKITNKEEPFISTGVIPFDIPTSRVYLIPTLTIGEVLTLSNKLFFQLATTKEKANAMRQGLAEIEQKKDTNAEMIDTVFEQLLFLYNYEKK